MIFIEEFELKKIREEYPGFDALTDAEKDAHIHIHRKKSMAREASVRLKAQELDKIKVESQHARYEAEKAAIEEQKSKYIITPDDVGMRQTLQGQQIEDEAYKWSVPFINSGFDDVFSLEAGFTMLGAITGHGKTTALSAMIAHAYKNIRPDTRILVISNEQGKVNYLNRIACAILKIDYQKYRQRNSKTWVFTQKQIDLVSQMSIALESKIKVLAMNDTTHKDLFVLENVIEVLDQVKKEEEKWALVAVDYLQTINLSLEKGPNGGSRQQVDISHAFGNYL